MDLGYQYLSQQKNLAELFQIIDRSINLSWRHHYEVSSLKQIEGLPDGKLELSDNPNKEKMQWFLNKDE